MFQSSKSIPKIFSGLNVLNILNALNPRHAVFFGFFVVKSLRQY